MQFQKLSVLPSPDDGGADQQWYYMAPVLLDSVLFPDGERRVSEWFEAAISYMEGIQKKSAPDAPLKHFQAFRTLYETCRTGEFPLKQRPADLVEVLADMALASPAVCFNRAFCRYGADFSPEYPTQAAQQFVRRMNTPESTSVVKLTCGENYQEKDHWRALLRYGAKGCLQAVLDEYCHVLISGVDKNARDLIPGLTRELIEGIRLRTASYHVETQESFQKKLGQNPEGDSAPQLRTHFAVSFGGDGHQESVTARRKSVRDSFNSPFWPFVLTTTSIGQEGLDFHSYCRRIVHWNLPSNPIDFEQREGRINRYESLAIRQTVARRYGNICFQGGDPWKEMFMEAARREKSEGCSDLIPHWGLTDGEDLVRIERVILAYPFSIEKERCRRLLKILSLYRMTLGQPHQEELLNAVMRKDGGDLESWKHLFLQLSPFYRLQAGKGIRDLDPDVKD